MKYIFFTLLPSLYLNFLHFIGNTFCGLFIIWHSKKNCDFLSLHIKRCCCCFKYIQAISIVFIFCAITNAIIAAYGKKLKFQKVREMAAIQWWYIICPTTFVHTFSEMSLIRKESTVELSYKKFWQKRFVITIILYKHV